jgi:hypothetical protein
MGNSKSKKIVPAPNAIIYNLKGKEIPFIDEGYYNLETNRKNKDKREGLFYDDVYRVGGTNEQMTAFYEFNHIHTNRVCSLSNKNTVIYAPDTDDVEKLSDLQISTLCPFNLFGLQSKCKVVNVYDGDTIDILAYVPFDFLYVPKYYQHERKSVEHKEHSNLHLKQVALLKSSKPTSKKISEGGVFLVFNCRLLNVDAQELNTAAGKVAAQVTADLFKSLNDIIYVRFGYADKYGRMLIDIYADPGYSKYLNFYLLEHPDPMIGPLAQKYDGGTKGSFK